MPREKPADPTKTPSGHSAPLRTLSRHFSMVRTTDPSAGDGAGLLRKARIKRPPDNASTSLTEAWQFIPPSGS
jgi:hypothetical protein